MTCVCLRVCVCVWCVCVYDDDEAQFDSVYLLYYYTSTNTDAMEEVKMLLRICRRVCSHMHVLTYAGVCWRMLTYADYADVW